MSCKLNVYVIDLCGTLTLNQLTKRRELIPPVHLRQTPGAWDAFSLAGADEIPNAPMVALTRELRAAGNSVYIVTGRGEIAKQVTIDWLKRVGAEWDLLIMRPFDDMRPDHEYKRDVLINQIGLERISMCFDDTPAVIKELRSLGLCVCQVTDCLLVPED